MRIDNSRLSPKDTIPSDRPNHFFADQCFKKSFLIPTFGGERFVFRLEFLQSLAEYIRIPGDLLARVDGFCDIRR